MSKNQEEEEELKKKQRQNQDQNQAQKQEEKPSRLKRIAGGVAGAYAGAALASFLFPPAAILFVAFGILAGANYRTTGKLARGAGRVATKVGQAAWGGMKKVGSAIKNRFANKKSEEAKPRLEAEEVPIKRRFSAPDLSNAKQKNIEKKETATEKEKFKKNMEEFSKSMKEKLESSKKKEGSNVISSKKFTRNNSVSI